MTTTSRSKNTELRVEREDDEATPEDLRAIVSQLNECWQLGDHNVMREARNALLAVFRNSANRLTQSYRAKP